MENQEQMMMKNLLIKHFRDEEIIFNQKRFVIQKSFLYEYGK